MGGLPSTKFEKNKKQNKVQHTNRKKKKYNIQTEKRKTTDLQTKTSFSFLFERNKNHEFV
jgi:hypothetical protein